ncbi:MAG: hypothetical protein JXX29_21355 [Deltaproteobacteria bacterium]|nr:hypothetical protein [Deltaproteobacteria bacterium]MBN2674244.1 hypothetical protein [Deltaproteobacteria bacterium]
MKKKTVSATLLVDLASEVVRRGGLFRFYSRGFSMLPDIGDREQVTVGAVIFSEVKLGDVLLCTTDNAPVLHRVIHKSYRSGESFLLLSSDNGDQIHRVRTADIIGKVVDVKRSKWRMVKQMIGSMRPVSIRPIGLISPIYKSYRSHKSYI